MTTALTKIPGIGPSTAKVLTENGFKSARQLADTTIAQLSKVPGFSTARASRTIKAANAMLSVSADASASAIATTTTKPNAAQTTMRQRRIAKKPASRATSSAPVSVSDTKAEADTKEPVEEEMTGKEQEKAAKKAAKKAEKKAAKKAKKAAKKAKKAAKKVKKAAKKAKRAAAKKAKKKAKSKKNKK